MADSRLTTIHPPSHCPTHSPGLGTHEPHPASTTHALPSHLAMCPSIFKQAHPVSTSLRYWHIQYSWGAPCVVTFSARTRQLPVQRQQLRRRVQEGSLPFRATTSSSYYNGNRSLARCVGTSNLGITTESIPRSRPLPSRKALRAVAHK